MLPSTRIKGASLSNSTIFLWGCYSHKSKITFGLVHIIEGMLIIWAIVCLDLAAVVNSVRALCFRDTWGLESQVSWLLAVWPWAGHTIDLNFRFLIYKTGITQEVAVQTTMCLKQWSNFFTMSNTIASSLSTQEMSPFSQKQINNQVETK